MESSGITGGKIYRSETGEAFPKGKRKAARKGKITLGKKALRRTKRRDCGQQNWRGKFQSMKKKKGLNAKAPEILGVRIFYSGRRGGGCNLLSSGTKTGEKGNLRRGGKETA